MITIFLLNDTTGFSTLYILACVIHETGHIIAFNLLKIKPKSLTFDITGVKLEHNKLLPFKIELIILLAGSLSNFIISILLYCVDILQFNNFIIFNLIIGSFNLLPLKGFDGGKILSIIISNLHSDEFSYSFTKCVDIFVTNVLFALSIFGIFVYNLNLSYIILTLVLFLSLFFKKNK